MSLFFHDSFASNDRLSLFACQIKKVHGTKGRLLHGDSAVAALVGECNNLMQKSTFRPMHLFDMTGEERKSIIRSKTFMKEKTLADGSFDKLKARLVAGGHQQNRSIYTKEETASPTVGTASVFTCAAIAAHERRGGITMDLAAAFPKITDITGLSFM